MAGTLGVSGMLRTASGLIAANSAIVQILRRCTPTKKVAVIDKFIPVDDTSAAKQVPAWQMLKDRSFVLYTIAVFLICAGIWMPYFYIRAFASEVLVLNTAQSFADFMMLNAAGMPGRILLALLADNSFGTINAYVLVMRLMSVVVLVWPVVHTPLLECSFGQASTAYALEEQFL